MRGPKKERKEFLVMIVEAGEIGLSTRKLVLETVGLNVVSVVSIAQAQRLLGRHSVDALIYDMDVEESSAINFLKSVHEKNPNMPIFVLTRHEWMPEALKGIARRQFQKVQDPGIMVEAVVEVLDSSESRQKTA